MKDWLKQTITRKASSLLVEGKEVEPTFFGVNAQKKVFVMPLGELFSSETGMNRAVALGQGLVQKHRLTLTALVYEAWLSKVDLKPGRRPRQDPQHKELLILMLETPDDLEVTTVPIKNRKLQLNERTILEEVDTRFRFFDTFEPPPLAA